MSPSDSGSRPEAEGIRLHPMTLAHRAIVSIPALVFILLPVFRSGDSTAWFNLILAAAYGAGVLPWLVIQYLRFRYWITDDEIVIHSGVLNRRRRNIPIDRIQNIGIERQVLNRMFGTARVRVHTAGSTQAEGSLDVVGLAEARRIRELVRAIQAGEASAPTTADGTEQPETNSESTQVGADDQARAAALFAMDPKRVLLAGCYRFSLLYLALAFSLLQYIDPDPEFAVRLVERLLGFDALGVSPWTTGLLAGAGAVLLGWVSGIAMTVNRYWGFRVEQSDGRLHLRQGLISVREGTIPLRKVQAIAIRTNPVMERFGWHRLEVQTMGTDVGERGHTAVVPFGRLEEIERVASRVVAGMAIQDRSAVEVPQQFEPVSKLTIRRGFIRYAFGIVVVAGVVSRFSAWGWLILALLIPAIFLAFERYRRMGYALGETRFWVRSGVFGRAKWMIPLSRLQVVYVRASPFQRRLRLATIYTDTAGASPVRGPDVVDVEASVADSVAARIYRRFGSLITDAGR